MIICDGPISGEAEQILKEYANKYSNLFTVVPLAENHGLAYALDRGMEECRNNLVMRMDSDDVSFLNRAELQVHEFELDKQLALLGANTQHFKNSPGDMPDTYSSKPIGEDEIRKTIRRNSAFSHPTVMFRKDAVEACGGYDPTLRRSQDHDLFSKMIFQGFRCKNINDVVVFYRADENGVLRNRNKESLKARIVIQNRLLRRKQCTILDYAYVVLGSIATMIIPESLYIRLYSLIKEHRKTRNL